MEPTLPSLSVSPQQLGFLIPGGPGAPRAAEPRKSHGLWMPALRPETGAQPPELQTLSAANPPTSFSSLPPQLC